MMIAMYCLSVSRNNYVKMNYRRELFSKTTFSSLWYANFEEKDICKQFLNRVGENTKVLQGKIFITTNNYGLFYSKQ